MFTLKGFGEVNSLVTSVVKNVDLTENFFNTERTLNTRSMKEINVMKNSNSNKLSDFISIFLQYILHFTGVEVFGNRKC